MRHSGMLRDPAEEGDSWPPSLSNSCIQNPRGAGKACLFTLEGPQQQKGEPRSRNKHPPECHPLSSQKGTPTPSQHTAQRKGGSFPSEWSSIFLSSQDSLPDDTDKAVWSLGLCSWGSPLHSWPPCWDEGAQVTTAPQVQQARLSPRGQCVGPGSAGLWWGHDLFQKTGTCDGFLHVLLIRLQNRFNVFYKFMDVWGHTAGGLLQESGHQHLGIYVRPIVYQRPWSTS